MLARDRVEVEAAIRFEPLARVVDQGESGHRRLANGVRGGDQVVVGRFRLGVEDAVLPDGSEPFGFVVGHGVPGANRPGHYWTPII